MFAGHLGAAQVFACNQMSAPAVSYADGLLVTWFLDCLQAVANSLYRSTVLTKRHGHSCHTSLANVMSPARRSTMSMALVHSRTLHATAIVLAAFWRKRSRVSPALLFEIGHLDLPSTVIPLVDSPYVRQVVALPRPKRLFELLRSEKLTFKCCPAKSKS